MPRGYSRVTISRNSVLQPDSPDSFSGGASEFFRSWDLVCVLCVLTCVNTGGGSDVLLTNSERSALAYLSIVLVHRLCWPTDIWRTDIWVVSPGGCKSYIGFFNLCFRTLLLLLLLLLGFTTLLNISGHQRRFWHRAWKVQLILLRGSNFGLRIFYMP